MKFNEEDGLSYTEFFAFNKTRGNDINNLRDSDQCSGLLHRYITSEPSDGWFRRYWSNGNLRYEWYFKNGKQQGVSKGWWPNGDIKSERNYNKGRLHGKKTAWYETGDPYVIHDGQVAGTGYMHKGFHEGLWTDYHKNGQKWFEGIYRNKELISEKYWNEDGSSSSENPTNELQQFQKINPNYRVHWK